MEHGSHTGTHHEKLNTIENQAKTTRHTQDQTLGCRNRVGRHGHAGTQNQRPQGHGRPVQQQALSQGTGRAHTPNTVERAVNRENQGKCGHRKRYQTGRP